MKIVCAILGLFIIWLAAGVRLVSQSLVRSPTVTAGSLGVMPVSCQGGDLFVATNQPLGQQLYVCGPNGWYQTQTLGGSGALAMTNGTLDIVTSVVPMKNGVNAWGGLNSFKQMRLVPTAVTQICDSQSIGSIWLDQMDPKYTRFKVCLLVAGNAAWVLK